MDTHAAIRLRSGAVDWISEEYRSVVADSELLISPIVLLEISYLHEIGRVRNSTAVSPSLLLYREPRRFGEMGLRKGLTQSRHDAKADARKLTRTSTSASGTENRGKIRRRRLQTLEDVKVKEGTVVEVYLPPGQELAGPRHSIKELPFYGMWADRTDIEDGVSYVNKLRDNPWDNPRG